MVKETADGAWWVRVGGLVLPARIAGHPALEVTNTWAGWTADGVPIGADTESASRDYLRTGAHLATLAADRGLLDHVVDVDDAALVATRDFRPAGYRVALGLGTDTDLALVSELAAQARTHQHLARTPDGPRWRLDPDVGVRAPLLAAAAALADLVTGPDAARVRACPGHDCGWLFLLSGRRRWCQMAVCGNRAKQAAFAERQRDEGR